MNLKWKKIFFMFWIKWFKKHQIANFLCNLILNYRIHSTIPCMVLVIIIIKFCQDLLFIIIIESIPGTYKKREKNFCNPFIIHDISFWSIHTYSNVYSYSILWGSAYSLLINRHFSSSFFKLKLGILALL